jgi:signal transduction histidine kinase
VSRALTRWFDVGLAAAVVAAGLGEIWVPFASRQGDGSAQVSTLGVLVAGAALTQRRARPLTVGLVVCGAWLSIFVAAPTYVLFFGQFVAMAIAVFSTARHGAGRVPVYGAVCGAVVLLYIDLFVPELQAPGEIAFHWGVFTVVWLAGAGLRRSEQRAQSSMRRAIDAEVTAAELALTAVVEERTRIARELHDIVAHSVSTMVVQAGAAEQVVDDDPEYARQALAAIRATGADALAEMRRVVTMLRDEDEPGALAPQPGLDAVPALIEDARASGIDATLAVGGRPRDLPPGVDLAAYRIVQEALSNVRRHARASHVEVGLTYREDDLLIEVTDDGRGAAGDEQGHGLVGIRERAAMYGGTLDTGSVNGRGYKVRATLSVGSA